MVEDEATEDEDAVLDEVRGRVVGLLELSQFREQEHEGVACQRRDEEAFLGAEQAVHRAGGRACGIRDRPDGQRRMTPSATRRSAAASKAARVSSSCSRGPSTDGRLVTCLWESDSVGDVRSYVDETLGDASVNLCYEVEAAAAFAQAPEGIATRPPIAA